MFDSSRVNNNKQSLPSISKFFATSIPPSFLSLLYYRVKPDNDVG